ncbi:hypothetical protein [Acetobacter sp. DsW_063]|uniref:hypothetical protein n=1 Tax=Acetobacter sp. DsW_063 TaxID=1514894 RepID=UPI000A389A78|nr:hypothetical protein [Acetobacter sp. DsW_063]OUJ16381.1 hypothetical protein HK28_00130 [Acetobacter sp. DsW_063]
MTDARPMTAKEARRFNDAVADVICWHQGFRAGARMGDASYNEPGGLDALGDLRTHLRAIYGKA